MNTLCDSFDPYFERWYAEVYRLCLVLTLHPKDAQQLLFDAALRLGAAKDPHIGEEAAKALFFESAVRLCEDYYLRRMRKAPRRESLSAALSFPLTDALWTLMHLPFKKRAALCLLHAGFTPQQAAKMAALRTAPATRPAFKCILTVRTDTPQRCAVSLTVKYSMADSLPYPAKIGSISACQKDFLTSWWRGSKLSTIRNGHPAAPSGLQCSLAHWAYFALLRPQGARFVRPPPLPPLPVSAKILRIFGRGNCKEAIFALKNGIFRRKNRSAPAVHAAGDD